MKYIPVLAVLLLSACGGSGSGDDIELSDSRTAKISEDGSQNIVGLTIGELHTGKYGYNYGTLQLDQMQFDLSACTGIATVEVQGYDIDRSTEVQVFSAADSIGYLSKGRGNNRLNSGDTFVVDNTQNQADILGFTRLQSGEKWGVTNLLLSICDTSGGGDPGGDPDPEDPPVDPGDSLIQLSAVVNTDRYGHNYGTSQNYTEARFGFDNDSNVRRLQVSGYDINQSDEVSVWLNSSFIGNLTRGRKRKLNGGDEFVFPLSLQNDGQNTVIFRQKSAGGTWGVTNLALQSEPDIGAGGSGDPEEPEEPPVEEPPVVDPPDAGDPIPLLTTVNQNEYGHEYGNNSHENAVSFSFDNTGADSYVSVHGFDIDTKKEVQVELNGELIGHLTKGANQVENEGDVYLLPLMDQIAGENIVTFRQSKNAGEPWGVTNLQLLGCKYQVNGTTASSGTPVVIDEATGTLIYANFFNGGAISDGTDRTVAVCVSEKDDQGNRFAHFTTDVGQDDNTQIKAYPEFIIGSKFGLTSETSFRPYPSLVSSTGFEYPALDVIADIVGLPTFTYNIPDIDVVIDIDEQNVVGSIRDVMLESWFYDTSANPEVVGNHALNSSEWSAYRALPPTDTQGEYFFQGESIQNTLNNLVGGGHPNREAAGNVLMEMMVHVGPLSPNDISGTSRNPSRFRLTDTPITIGDYQYHIWYSSTYLAPLVVYSRETNALGQPLLNLTEEGEINLDWNLFLDYTLNSLEPQLAAAGVAWAQGAENVFPKMRATSGAIGSLEFGIEPQTNNSEDEPYRATVRRFEVYIRGKNFGL